MEEALICAVGCCTLMCTTPGMNYELSSTMTGSYGTLGRTRHGTACSDLSQVCEAFVG